MIELCFKTVLLHWTQQQIESLIKISAKANCLKYLDGLEKDNTHTCWRIRTGLMDYDRAHLLIHCLDARNTLLNMILSTLLIYDLQKILTIHLLAHGHTLADIQSVNHLDAIVIRIHQDTSMQSSTMGDEMCQVDVSLSDKDRVLVKALC